MKTSILLRTSLLTAAFGLALSAHAVSIFVTSHGTGANDPITQDLIQNETVIQQSGGLTPYSTLTLDTETSTLPLTGTGTYTGAGGTLTFTYALTEPSLLGDAQSASGTWTATGSNMGSGTLSITLLSATSGFETGTLFAGSYQAVPEPASLAALGVGALGLLRRRKRA